MFQRFSTGTALGLAVVLAISATACRPPDSRETQGVVPELKLEGVRFRVYRGDALRAFGEADAMSLRRDSGELAVRAITATLPHDPAPVRITAPEGSGVVPGGTFAVSGGVTLTRGTDMARTDRARYAPTDDGGRVTGDDPVAVSGRGYRLDGVGFELDPARGEIEIRRGARLVAGLPEAR